MVNSGNTLLRLLWVLGKTLPESLTLRRMAKEAKIPYATAYRVVKRHESLFSIKRKGNIKLCSINLEDPILKHYLILAERQKAEEFIQKNHRIRIIRKELPEGDYACILFGSRADATHREKSDIDLCIINRDGKRNLSFSTHELIFKIEINPIYLKRTEFRQMLKEKTRNLAHEILSKHIILHGEEYFWDIIYPWASR